MRVIRQVQARYWLSPRFYKTVKVGLWLLSLTTDDKFGMTTDEQDDELGNLAQTQERADASI